MRYLFFTFLFFISFTLIADAERTFSPMYFGEKEEGKDGFLDVPPAYYKRDTILADGRISHIYRAIGCCYGHFPNEWCYIRLPDSIKLLISCDAEFHYPTGMEPGLYNFVPNLVDVIGLDKYGDPIVRTKHWYAPWKDPEINPDLKSETKTTPTSEPASSSNPCTIQVRGKTIPLYGRVQVVTSFGDIKVAESNFPDLQVEKVNCCASKCGQWEFVDSFPDFTIEYSNFPDLKIQFSNFPGMR